MNAIKAVLISVILGLMAGCAQPYSMDMSEAIQNAKTKTDHEALAAHYEQMARDMRAESEEHKKRLVEYQAILPKEDQEYYEFVDHCSKLIKIYAQAENENLELARLHRQMASRHRN